MFAKKEDPVYARGLVHLVNEANLELKGKEASALLKLLVWINDLEKRFKADLDGIKPKKKTKTPFPVSPNAKMVPLKGGDPKPKDK